MSKSKAKNPFDLQENSKSQKANNNVSPKSLSEVMDSIKKSGAGGSALGSNLGFGATSDAMDSLRKSLIGSGGLGATKSVTDTLASLTKPAIGAGGFGATGAMSEVMDSIKKSGAGGSALGSNLGFGATSDAMDSLRKSAIGAGGLGATKSVTDTLASLNKTSTKNIHKTANALVKSGKRPTLAAIRDELGGGSFTTISEAMKSWREEQEELEQTLATKLPPDLENKLQTLGVSMWETANMLANECLSKDYDALKVMQENIIGKLAQAKEIIRSLEQEKEQINAELEQLRVENEQSKAELRRYGTARQNTSEELKKAHNQIDEQGDQIKKLLDQQQELIDTLTRFSKQ